MKVMLRVASRFPSFPAPTARCRVVPLASVPVPRQFGSAFKSGRPGRLLCCGCVISVCVWVEPGWLNGCATRTRSREGGQNDAFKGFQIRCSTSTKALATVAIPLLLMGMFVSWSTLDKDLPWPILAAVGLQAVIGVAFSWKLGIRTAKARMAGSPISGEVPRQHS